MQYRVPQFAVKKTMARSAGMCNLLLQPFHPLGQAVLPVLGQAGNVDNFRESVEVRSVGQLDPPELIDGEAVGLSFQEHDRILGLDEPWLDDPVVPASDPLLRHVHRHPLDTEAMADLPAWAARLGRL